MNIVKRVIGGPTDTLAEVHDTVYATAAASTAYACTWGSHPTTLQLRKIRGCTAS